MAKFHVGDRWADQDGDEWLVFAVHGTVISAGSQSGSEGALSGSFAVFFDDPDSLDRLTRLISSERWIPFAEMMPEHTAPGDKRALLASRVGFEPYILSRTGTDAQWVCWRDRDETDYDTLAELIADGVTHWRYLLPPEAP